MTLLEVARARVVVSGLTILSNISLRVDDRDFLGLVGPNGAGKTTLLNCIDGQIRLDSGTIHLEGYDITEAAIWTRARRGIGRTFQDGRLWPGLAPWDHFRLAGWSPVRAPAAVDDIKQAIDLVELQQVAMAGSISQLALIDRRRLELALQLVRKPALLLLDEIAAGLNTAESAAMYGYVTEAMKRKFVRAVIAVEHKLALLSAYATEMASLDEGVIRERKSAETMSRGPRPVAYRHTMDARGEGGVT